MQTKDGIPGPRGSGGILLIAVLLTLSGLEGTSAAAAGECSASEKAKVGRFVREYDASVGLGETSQFSKRCTELNGKAPQEALMTLEGPSNCGARGCAGFALDLSGPKARSVGDFIAATLEPLSTRTNGWRDLSLNGTRMTFQNGAYKPYK